MGVSGAKTYIRKERKEKDTMKAQVFTRTGAILHSQGETVGEIAKEIGVDPTTVWRDVRRHVLYAARAGKKPLIQPEHWLWQHDGSVDTIRIIKNPEMDATPELRNILVAGGNVQK